MAKPIRRITSDSQYKRRSSRPRRVTSAGRLGTFIAILAVLLIVSTVCSDGRAESPEHPPLAPLPSAADRGAEFAPTKAMVELGRQLFFDPRLSGDNQMSCATCHDPAKAFGDGKARAIGADKKVLKRNTPTVLNVGFLSSFFWDGRAPTLEAQALMPIESPEEMNQKLGPLIHELNGIDGYVKQFRQVFGSPVTKDELARALAAYQRTLITPNAPFDRFLRGDKSALSKKAILGYRLFTGDAGCIRCHNGPMLSDGKFYRVGVDFVDRGREQVTGDRDDIYKFRTPSLRNVAKTGPYMHNGSLKTLDDVASFYYRGVPTSNPKGVELDVQPLADQSFSEIPAIVAFLESLTGEFPKVEP